MITYTDLYEILRKEKYSEILQQLPKNFIQEVSEYLSEKNRPNVEQSDLFSDSLAKSKKQFENAIAIFKELILRRKRKILNLVFVATETGITKRDYENLLEVEKETFEALVKAFEDCDKNISRTLNGRKEKISPNKLILFKQDVEQFVNPEGEILGPFKSGELANISTEIAKILVAGEKATFVDEN